jgi:hypothetical protein
MNALTDKWPLVASTAKALGVGDDAMRKWRERERIPFCWHAKLIERSRGKLKASDFIARKVAEAGKASEAAQ